MLAPMLTNIILIDLCYGVDPGATGVAILLLAAMIGLVAPHRRELITLFWPAKSRVEGAALLNLLKWGVRIAMLAVAFGLTHWTANFNNRAPTPIDGAWDLIRVEPEALAEQVPSTFFFEYNRVNMTVFKTRDGVYQTHGFEIDRNSNQIRMWETWLQKETQIFEGTNALA